MLRCHGGQSQRGQHRSGRMHMDGGDGNCAKYLSDEFDRLSTISKAMGVDQQANQDGETIMDSLEDHNDNRMRASSTASTLGDIHACSSTADLGTLMAERSAPSASVTGSTASPFDETQYQDDRLLEAILDADEPALVRANNAPVRFHENMNSSWRVLLLFLLTLILYGWYRWIYQQEFEYQSHVIRGHYGLSRKCELY